MSAQAFLLKGTATIRMEGVAKIIDIEGNTVREVNLADLGEREAVLQSTCLFWPESLCSITFAIDDVFAPDPKVEVART